MIGISKIMEEMDQYYRDRVPYHDYYMGYTSNEDMEKLLAPLIDIFQDEIRGKDVLEIACGTSNWTHILSRIARSVMATDFLEEYIVIAKRKTQECGNVSYKVADAYLLEGIRGDFNAAFFADWWSHIPHSRIKSFLDILHSKLIPPSRVVVLDMLRTAVLQNMFSHKDEEMNEIQKRSLPTGKIYHVVKNFPTENELRNYLREYAEDITFVCDHKLARWVLMYTTV
jgi:demethylmenaquinone methyltransferase/2-methoxy-6-polyprenyl-1,4-benzoquinol methylase